MDHYGSTCSMSAPGGDWPVWMTTPSSILAVNPCPGAIGSVAQATDRHSCEGRGADSTDPVAIQLDRVNWLTNVTIAGLARDQINADSRPRSTGILSHARCRQANGVQDFRVRRTAAEISRQIVADLVVAGVGVLLEKLPHHQDESRCAESALECTGLDECLLDGVELVALGEPFDRLHLGAVGKDGQEQARRNRFRIDDDRAAPAQTLAAAFARATQIELVLQDVDEVLIRHHVCRNRHSVQLEANPA